MLGKVAYFNKKKMYGYLRTMDLEQNVEIYFNDTTSLAENIVNLRKGDIVKIVYKGTTFTSKAYAIVSSVVNNSIKV